MSYSKHPTEARSPSQSASELTWMPVIKFCSLLFPFVRTILNRILRTSFTTPLRAFCWVEVRPETEIAPTSSCSVEVRSAVAWDLLIGDVGELEKEI